MSITEGDVPSTASLEAVAARLRACRKEARLTQREVGEQVGVSRRSVWGWENALAVPRESLPAVARLYGRTEAWILTGFDQSDVDAVIQLRIEHDALVKSVALLAEQVEHLARELDAERRRRRRPGDGSGGS
jgi:transcriptional regulator with XRE-family HTH domain